MNRIIRPILNIIINIIINIFFMFLAYILLFTNLLPKQLIYFGFLLSFFNLFLLSD